MGGKETPVILKPSEETVQHKPKRLLTDVSLSFEEVDHLQTTLAVIQSRRYNNLVRKPWLDEDGNQIWSEWRIRVAKIVFSQVFETCMGVIIVFNLAIIVYEADQDAMCYPKYMTNYFECPQRSEMIPWLHELNIFLLVIYSLECGVRAFVERQRFLCNGWNISDLMTVILGWTSMAVSTVNLSLLRLSRLVRVGRAARVFITVPEFYLLLSGLFSSMKAIIFGSVILISVIGFWAVIAVEILHPEVAKIEFPHCERCQGGFRSVGDASITLFQQIVAGDSWGEISIPLMEHAVWSAPLLFVIMVSVSLGVMNLILAVIVERATEARENDQERKLKRKDMERNKNMVDFAVLCHDMDADDSGSLSLHEMLKGYDENDNFRKLMDIMDLKRQDMETIFRVLDTDCSGEVSYIEFCQHLGSFWERDPIMLQSLVKYSVMEVRKVIDQEVMAVLREQTELLREQRQLLREKLGPCSTPYTKPEPWKPPEMRSFSNLQEELAPLLARATQLVAEAIPDPAEEEKWIEWSSQGFELDERGDAPPGDLVQQVEQHFAVACEAFERRISEAQAFQLRCRHLVDHLKDMRSEAVKGKTCLLEVPV